MKAERKLGRTLVPLSAGQALPFLLQTTSLLQTLPEDEEVGLSTVHVGRLSPPRRQEDFRVRAAPPPGGSAHAREPYSLLMLGHSGWFSCRVKRR